MFQKKVVEKIKTHILYSVNFYLFIYLFYFILFFFLNRSVYEIKWENILERGRAADDNMMHAYCMLDT